MGHLWRLSTGFVKSSGAVPDAGSSLQPLNLNSFQNIVDKEINLEDIA